MGRFSTTVHIKNKVDKMVFENLFCEVMKKRGFVPCSEDEAAQSYLLAFSEGGWVTLVSKEYSDSSQKASEDSILLARELKTSVFSAEVVDSDFALLRLCNSGGGRNVVIVGDGSGYGIEKPMRGKKKLWEPLLAVGRTWEQFSETVVKDEVFVEDTLAELAEVLGIDSDYICADFDEVLNLGEENKNVMAFYFKKYAENILTLKAAFIKVFGEALEPLGFKKIKGKHPYFVRVVPRGGRLFTSYRIWKCGVLTAGSKDLIL